MTAPLKQLPGETLDLGSWCILRMASADTLRVAKSLAAAGLQVWTPVERRSGRSRHDRSRFDKETALMPSYVFGRVEHLTEMLRLAMLPQRNHPKFSVFRYQGGIPLIADEQLDALRAEEDRSLRLFERLKRRGLKGPAIASGTTVKMTEGAFAGLSGVVEDQQGQYTLVSIDGFHKPIKVASVLLLEESAGQCARAA